MVARVSEAELIKAASPATADLATLRDALAAVDADLVALLATRHELVQQVGAHKRALGVAVLDPAREAAVIRRAAELARERGLPADPVRELFRRIMALARDTQLDTLAPSQRLSE